MRQPLKFLKTVTCVSIKYLHTKYEDQTFTLQTVEPYNENRFAKLILEDYGSPDLDITLSLVDEKTKTYKDKYVFLTFHVDK